MLAVGLQLQFLHEFPFTCFQKLPWMEKGTDGWWRLPNGDERIAFLFSLMAIKAPTPLDFAGDEAFEEMFLLDSFERKMKRGVQKMEIIRAYKTSDWPRVSEIYDLSKPDEMGGLVDPAHIKPLTQDEQMLRYFYESEIWVYENEQKIKGFIGRKGNVISWLFVHPDYRRKGIARKLLAKLMDEHHDSLKLNVVKDNYATMSLYRNLGFKVFEEFEGNMYGEKIPAVRRKIKRASEPIP